MLDFLGIGAQKAGTTWLYEMLSRHPGIAFPGGKELHFWNGLSDRDRLSYEKLFNRDDGRKHGEITPAYAILPHDIIREIHALNPALRIIYLLRNPIDRAWSSACMALARAEMTLDEASDQWFIDHFRSRGSLQRGDYEQCIRNWREVFGVEPLLILRYEDIRSDPRGLLRSCCKHLGVAADAWADALPDELVSRQVFAGQANAIRPSLLQPLHELYSAKISNLSEYLGMDLSSWLQSPSRRT